MSSAHRDDPRTDQQLVAAINAGELDAFDAIYWRYREWVVRLARRFTGKDEDALDVLQETFAYVYRKFPGFVLAARLTTFLYPVVRNLSLAARRKSGRFTTDEEALAVLPDVSTRRDGIDSDLAGVVAHLPQIHREVLLMRFVDDMSLDEIAHALRVPPGTIKSRLHYAIEALRSDPRTRCFWEKGP